jgi:hypothetical protein
MPGSSGSEKVGSVIRPDPTGNKFLLGPYGGFANYVTRQNPDIRHLVKVGS